MKYAIKTFVFFMFVFSIVFWMSDYKITSYDVKFLYGFFGGWIGGDYMRVFKKKFAGPGINVYRHIGQIVGFLIVAIIWPWSMFVIARHHHKHKSISNEN